MTEIKHMCDRCRMHITENRTAMDIRCGPLLAHITAIDLCGRCLTALNVFMRELSPTDPEPKDE